jgi:hypothetical protein
MSRPPSCGITFAAGCCLRDKNPNIALCDRCEVRKKICYFCPTSQWPLTLNLDSFTHPFPESAFNRLGPHMTLPPPPPGPSIPAVPPTPEALQSLVTSIPARTLHTAAHIPARQHPGGPSDTLAALGNVDRSSIYTCHVLAGEFWVVCPWLLCEHVDLKLWNDDMKNDSQQRLDSSNSRDS